MHLQRIIDKVLVFSVLSLVSAYKSQIYPVRIVPEHQKSKVSRAPNIMLEN